MPSYEELVTNERALREILASGAEEELRAIPGVVHVSVGLKERGGRVTDELSLRVYVREKHPSTSLSASERVPPRIAGVATDVIVLGEYDFGSDNARYRPILGGIQITNGIVGPVVPPSVARGTLGCIATLISDGAPMLLTCDHVLSAFGAEKKKDRVYQPGPVSVPAYDPAELPKRPAKAEDEFVIATIEDFSMTSEVDVGIARIDVSSWCRCCGIESLDEINGISAETPAGSGVFKPPTNGIVGQRVAVADMKVFKVGQRTGRTAGRVVTASFGPVTIGGTGRTFTNQIEIESTDPATRFSRVGDSGAVIIDEDGYIVGMKFAQNDRDPPLGRTLANHIADVCAEVGITINFKPTGTTAAARVAIPPALGRIPGTGAEAYRVVRERLMRDPTGAELLALAEAHRAEVVRLVTQRRPVTVAWHRVQGPAFLATALNTFRAGGDALPREVDGLSVHAALERMGAVLAAHGSPELRTAITRHGPALLEATLDSATVDDVIRKLNGTALRTVTDLAESHS